MAVLDRSYRPWDGAPTPYWMRMLVIPRYSIATILSKRLALWAYAAMLLPPAFLFCAVYLSVNLPALQTAVPMFREFSLFEVGSRWYEVFWRLQATASTFFAIVVGPPLIASDMANNALPLYFSKALRRIDYLFGKALVLLGLISFASWVPLCAIYCLHRSMASPEWIARNGGTGLSLLAASVAHLVVVTALILAVSALVQRTNLARVGLFAVFVLSMAVGGALAGATNRDAFLAASPTLMVERIGEWAFDDERTARDGTGLVGAAIPVSRTTAVLGLLAWTTASCVVLARRVRPTEVIR